MISVPGRRFAALIVVASLASTLAACGTSDDDERRPADARPSSTPPAPDAPSSLAPSSSSTPYPAFSADDYTYRLEVQCRCPQFGVYRVRVHDGDAVGATGLTGRFKSKPAPVVARLSINDIIDLANSPTVEKVKVVWPAGSDHPTSVRMDRLRQATDDEVTYLIRKVRVSAG